VTGGWNKHLPLPRLKPSCRAPKEKERNNLSWRMARPSEGLELSWYLICLPASGTQYEKTAWKCGRVLTEHADKLIVRTCREAIRLRRHRSIRNRPLSDRSQDTGGGGASLDTAHQTRTGGLQKPRGPLDHQLCNFCRSRVEVRCADFTSLYESIMTPSVSFISQRDQPI
jgi:hypothetical protein